MTNLCLGTPQTCKDLYRTIQDRHVWVDQLEKLCQKDPALRSAVPPPTSLSAQALKTFVSRRVKLGLRWGTNGGESGFAVKGLAEVPGGICRLWLLPGGKSALVIDDREDVTLRRVELDDGRASLPIVANIKYGQGTTSQWTKLLTAMSPCPIFVHDQGEE